MIDAQPSALAAPPLVTAAEAHYIACIATHCAAADGSGGGGAPPAAPGPSAAVLSAKLTTVYRRVLANLLLDGTNPKFRALKESNGVIGACLAELGVISVPRFVLCQAGDGDAAQRGGGMAGQDARLEALRGTSSAAAATAGAAGRRRRLHVGLTLFQWLAMRRGPAPPELGAAIPSGVGGARAVQHGADDADAAFFVGSDSDDGACEGDSGAVATGSPVRREGQLVASSSVAPVPPVGHGTLAFGWEWHPASEQQQQHDGVPTPSAVHDAERRRLRQADARLSLLEQRLHEAVVARRQHPPASTAARSAGGGGGGGPSLPLGNSSAATATAASDYGSMDVNAPGKRRLEAMREKERHIQQLQLQQQAEAQARLAAAAASAVPDDRDLVFCAADFDEARPLVEVCRRTLHFTGRLRNYSFEAKHFTVRRMRHSRVFACASRTDAACPTSHLEAHWHVVNGNILYAYVAHFTESGESVVHLGPEYGYQYNPMPGTDHFRKTVLFSVKQMDPATGAVLRLEHPNKVAETCILCDKPFAALLL